MPGRSAGGRRWVLQATAILVAGCGTNPRTVRAEHRDRDADSIVDVRDLCTTQAEDFDGFEDQDGCMDPDNDRDRIADASDSCPNEPELYNGTRDDDGCPDHGHVEITCCVDVIVERIYFRRRSSAIRVTADPVLDALAASIEANPPFELIALVGRAAGDEPDADGLAMRRAEAVRSALVARHVAPARLESWSVGANASLGEPEHDRSVELVVRRRMGEPIDAPIFALGHR